MFKKIKKKIAQKPTKAAAAAASPSSGKFIKELLMKYLAVSIILTIFAYVFLTCLRTHISL
jgi:hypothetical protein